MDKKKVWYINIMEHYSALVFFLKKGNLAICNIMDELGMHDKYKPEKGNKYYVVSLRCGIFKKKIFLKR